MNHYVLFAIIGFVVAAAVYMFLVKKESYSLSLSIFMAVASLTGLFAGGRLFGIISANIYRSFTGVSIVPGFVFYGGLTGFLIVYIILQKVALGGVSGRLCDITAVVIPLFHAFGRIGCYMTGCCGGDIPVQLMEAGFNLILFVLLLVLYMKEILKSNLLTVYLLSYGIFRFFIEFFRTDITRGVIGHISFGQICSLGIVFLVILYIALKNRDK